MNDMLKQKLRLILMVSSTAILFLQCSGKPGITEQNTSRILRALSSDSLKGRYAFSPEIKHAVSFISDEFEKAGLEPLPGLENYHQSFILYSISEDKSSVVLNQKAIPRDRYFAMMNSASFNWDQNSNIAVARITEDHHFKTKFNEYRSDTLSSLVIVDPSHQDLFAKYRRYFSRPARTLEISRGLNDVFVISNTAPATFDVSFSNSVEKFNLTNVAGMIEGHRKNEIVLFSAHYDHIGVLSPVDGDSIANGANDNASGVTGVIELARYYSSRGKPERTLYFVGFTAEESGGYGSKYFSRQLNPDHIVAMFNLEMIGKPFIQGSNYAWITGFERSTFGEILQKNTRDTKFEFHPDPYPNQNLFYRSDNATLARLGVPAHSISTTPIDIDKDYHSVTDEYETVHVLHLTNTIKAIAKAAEGIISGQDTPSRIDVSSLH